jgi:hypothetical protein
MLKKLLKKNLRRLKSKQKMLQRKKLLMVPLVLKKPKQKKLKRLLRKPLMVQNRRKKRPPRKLKKVLWLKQTQSGI